MKEYFNLSPVFTYFFRKKNTEAKESKTLKAMHIVNKVSIGVFLVCLLIILYRFFFRGV